MSSRTHTEQHEGEWTSGAGGEGRECGRRAGRRAPRGALAGLPALPAKHFADAAARPGPRPAGFSGSTAGRANPHTFSGHTLTCWITSLVPEPGNSPRSQGSLVFGMHAVTSLSSRGSRLCRRGHVRMRSHRARANTVKRDPAFYCGGTFTGSRNIQNPGRSNDSAVNKPAFAEGTRGGGGQGSVQGTVTVRT